jgi:hypothetical protein
VRKNAARVTGFGIGFWFAGKLRVESPEKS